MMSQSSRRRIKVKGFLAVNSREWMQPVRWGETIQSFKNFDLLTEQSQNHNPKTNPHKTLGSIEHELGEKQGLFSRESVRTHKNNGCKITLMFLKK